MSVVKDLSEVEWLKVAAFGFDKPEVVMGEFDGVVHVSGFVRPPSDSPFDSPVYARPSGVKVTTYRGDLADVASRVVAGIRENGHLVTTSTTRSLDGWLREVHAFVDVNGMEMWHLFTYASADQWSFGVVL